MDVETAMRAVSLLVAGMFVVSAVHKLDVLRLGGAALEPVLARHRLGDSTAMAVLALALVVECGLVVLLLLAPGYGFAGAAVLLLLYCTELRRLPAGQGCMCFGAFFDVASSATAIRRNVVVAAVAAACAVADGGSLVNVGAISEASVGTALIGALTLTALALLQRKGGAVGAPVREGG